MTKYIYTFLLFSTFLFSFGQEQWFPVQVDSLTKTLRPDTSLVFPVPYISIDKSKVLLYAHKSPYTMQMKLTKQGYYSDGLRIAIDKQTKPYAFAKYYFQKHGDIGTLIIKRDNVTDTIKFIKSKTKVDELKFKWG